MSIAARIAFGYFVVVCVALAVVAVIEATHTGPDASLASVWAIAAALPGSLVVLELPEVGVLAWFGLLLVVAAVQAFAIYGVIRLFRR